MILHRVLCALLFVTAASPRCTGAADTFCHQLSTCAGLHTHARIVRPVPPRFCLPRWKGITVRLYSNNNATSQRSINPCKAASSACWEVSLNVPFIEVITEFMTRRKVKVAFSPHQHHLVHIPLGVSWIFSCLFVTTFTYKWSLMNTGEKLCFYLEPLFCLA